MKNVRKQSEKQHVIQRAGERKVKRKKGVYYAGREFRWFLGSFLTPSWEEGGMEPPIIPYACLDLIKQVFEERERNNNDKSEKTNIFKLKSAVFEIC